MKIDKSLLRSYLKEANRNPVFQWIDTPAMTSTTTNTNPFYGFDSVSTTDSFAYNQTVSTYSVPAAQCNISAQPSMIDKTTKIAAQVEISDVMLAAAQVTSQQLEDIVKQEVWDGLQRAIAGFKVQPPQPKPRPGPPREFNPFLNASDQLEAFIKYVGEQGVRQGEVLGLPLDLFVKWLILEAAKKDDEPEPEGVVIVVEQPRCLGCQRWMPKCAESRKVPFCEAACLAMYSNRQNALEVMHG